MIPTPLETGEACRLEAHRLLAEGVSVIPLIGKRPAVKSWKAQQGYHATPPQIDTWWKMNPTAGVAVICGPISGVVVLDVDGDRGALSLARLIEENGQLPDDTPEVYTPGNGGKEIGGHFYFRLRPGDDPAKWAFGGLEMRSAGHYVVAPPSRHPDPADLLEPCYEWAQYFMCREETPELPPWLRLDTLPDWLIGATMGERGKSRRLRDMAPGEKIPHGERYYHMVSMIGALRRQALDAETIFAAMRVHMTMRVEDGASVPDSHILKVCNSAEGWEPDPDWDRQRPGMKGKPLNVGLADNFLADWQRGRLVWWESETYHWCGTHYVHIKKDSFRAAVAQWLGGNMPPKPATAKNDNPGPMDLPKTRTAGVLDLIHAEARIPWSQPAFWIPSNKPAGHLAILKNGVMDLNEAAQVDDPYEPAHLMPHDPALFTLASLPYKYDPAARAPRWLDFLHQCLEGNDDLITLLQEWFGYNLIPWTGLHKFMIMKGEGSNGKSQAMEVLRLMLGAENCCSVPLEQFKNSFMLFGMIGKLANICTEIGNPDTEAEGILKMIAAGETTTIDRKHRDAIQTAITARLTFATNEDPRFRDRTQGIYRRVLMIPWNVEIPEADQVDHLGEKLAAAELPGIFNWALAGLRCLIKQGRFSTSGTAAECVARLKQENNPAAQWLVDDFSPRWGTNEFKDDIYKAYAEDVKDRGCHPLAAANFWKEFRRFFRAIEYQEGQLTRNVRGEAKRCRVIAWPENSA